MHTKICTLSLSVLAGACALAMPTISHADNVGYNDAGGQAAGVPALITSLGHTPVPVTTLDATSLSGLSALVLTSCGSQPLLSAPNAALNTAVQNGMTLLVESGCNAESAESFIVSSNLPGAPPYSTSSSAAYPEADNIEIPAGSPIATGPGGNLSATSLDRIPAGSGGLYNMTHYYPLAALPSGATILLTTGNPNHVGALAWNVGSGRVIHSETQGSFVLPGSLSSGVTDSFKPGLVTYFTNLLVWATGPAGPSATCASEGYTGTKLTWCKNICESTLSGKVLDSWIHRWIERYRQLPYCAVGGLPD